MNYKHTKLHIAMAGGGTGGHAFPIKSLIDYIFQNKKYLDQIDKIFWFGTSNGLEQNISNGFDSRHFQFVPIISGKYRRETPFLSRLRNIRDIFLFIVGIFQSLYFLLYYRIDVIFCKGGYVALPVVLAGALLRKKIIVHESDTHPGLVNRVASRFAKKIFTGFDNVLPKSQTIGQIISDEIFQQDKQFTNKIGLSPFENKTIVLISGGSQGSKRLYKNLIKILKQNPKFQSEFIFFVALGLLNQDLSTEFDKLPNVRTLGFISQSQIGYLYGISDIGITRAGTTSLAEQKLFDMKLMIIPITRTHDQYDNAQYYANKYGDIFLDQRKSDFEFQLTHSLHKNIGFKKTISKSDRVSEIIKAKEIIVQSLLHLHL